MPTIQKILVPVDFSENTENAVRQAVDLASRYDAKITLLAINEPILSPESQLGAPPPDSCTFLTKRLKALAEKYSSESGEPLAHQCVTGSPASCILELAETQSFDFIVMSTHGRKGLTRWILGSVAEAVVREAICPVITVRPPKLEGAATDPDPPRSGLTGNLSVLL